MFQWLVPTGLGNMKAPTGFGNLTVLAGHARVSVRMARGYSEALYARHMHCRPAQFPQGAALVMELFRCPTHLHPSNLISSSIPLGIIHKHLSFYP